MERWRDASENAFKRLRTVDGCRPGAYSESQMVTAHSTISLIGLSFKRFLGLNIQCLAAT